jgi:hypothetical protein
MDNNTINAATENFNLPHDVVKLPTGGIFYKNKKSSVKVGYLTANDENLLINALTDGGDNMTHMLVRSKLYEHDTRPEDLLSSDIEAILLFLRNTSFGPEYNVKLTDPKTNKPFESTILLDEINIKKPQNLPNEDGTFDVILPKSGKKVKIKPLTFGESVEISKQKDSYPSGRVAPIVTWRLSKQIVELEGETDKGVINNFVNSLPIADSKFIRKYINENVPSLDLLKTVIAPSGEKVIVDITFGVEFFRPFF